MSMESKLTASAIISDEAEDNFLLVEEGQFPGVFNLPGGGPKAGETLKLGAARETFEESGMQVQLNSLVGIYVCHCTLAGNNVTRAVYAGSVINGEPTPSRDHPTVDFFSYKDIKKLEQHDRLRHSGVRLAVDDFRAGQRFDPDVITYLPPATPRK